VKSFKFISGDLLKIFTPAEIFEYLFAHSREFDCIMSRYVGVFARD